MNTKVAIGICVALTLFALGMFLSSSNVHSATSTTTSPLTKVPAEKADTPAESATPTPEAIEEYDKIADRFFEVLAEEGGEAAIEYAFSTHPFVSRISDEITMLIDQFATAERLVGDYVDHDMLLEVKVSDRIVVQYYLVVYDRQPFKFEFTFYRPHDEWMLQNFMFGDALEEVSVLTSLSLTESDKVEIRPLRRDLPPTDLAASD